MSDPNTTPPPYGGPAHGGPPPPPGSYGQPPPPGTYGHPPQPGQFPGQPYQQPAQAYAPWNPAEGWIPELGVKVAGAGTRIGAKAIDVVFYVILQTIGSIAVMTIWMSSDDFDSTNLFAGSTPSLLVSFLAALLLLAIDLAYNVGCTARFGGTPGKLILGLRVIYQDGRRIDLQGAFLRYTPILALAVLAMVPIVSILASIARLGLLIANLVMILTDDRRRDVFDRVASTYVITTR